MEPVKVTSCIEISFTEPGVHKYPQASKNHGYNLDFLEAPHRHDFGFNIRVPVNHDNRELEFFVFTEFCRERLSRMYTANEFGFDFESDSCEAIARALGVEILGYHSLDWCRVEVSEDDKNRAIVLLEKE